MRLNVLFCVCFVTFASGLGQLSPVLATETTIDFNRDIRSLLFGKCVTCHGPDEDERAADMRLDVAEGAMKDLGGYAAIVPGDAQASELIARITSEDEDVMMPPPGKGSRLTENEIELMREWIRQGAKYAKHWAYKPPQRPAIPTVENHEWPSNPIDHFTLAKMESAGIHPSREAGRYALARRLALDLTGIPPTWEQALTFVNDSRLNAYEIYVDSLLSHPGFGERWARVWLDLARYADSAGYADDPPRTIWAYRDYVIQSLNGNVPFDQFTIEQIAGDLLPNPTPRQLTATAFHRNTLTNNEGGTNDEEFRNVAVVDRVNTTMAVWMGTTMACAQCHTHKYDPITQEEYFKFFAFFNNTMDADKKDERPRLDLWSEEQERIRSSLAKSDEALAKMKPITSVPVMRELPTEKRRETRVQIRGNYQNTGQVVSEGTPAVFHRISNPEHPTRLDLAEWLVDANNPLTARVIVNRHWEQLFGIGIVSTSEEFGSQGELPSHPRLLDFLAVEFVESGWDVKRLIRSMVMSATYRQSSATNAEAVAQDPANRMLARGPRFRVSAEMVRDQALFVSGLLSEKQFGPPVKPPQPSLGLKAAFGSATDWKTSIGEDKYRRGLYTTWRRSSPYPSMAQFDAPNREVCTVRRIRTNTPLQALVTLNDPVYIEAAQAFARRLIRESTDDQERIERAFEIALIRPSTQAESDRVLQLLRQATSDYQQNPGEAMKMATEPLGPLPTGSDAVEFAAWTVVANVILNLDEMLMKR